MKEFNVADIVVLSILYSVLHENTGRSIWKITKVKGCIGETVHFYPMLVKLKCIWEGVDYLRSCIQTATKCKQVFKNWKIYCLSNAFWAYQHRVKNALFLRYRLSLL